MIKIFYIYNCFKLFESFIIYARMLKTSVLMEYYLTRNHHRYSSLTIQVHD